jgi:hypothetical protein
MNLSCRHFHQIVSPVLFRTLRIQFPAADRINPRRIELSASRFPTRPPPSRQFPPILVTPESRFKPPKAKTAKSRKVHPLIEPDIGHGIYHHIRVLVLSCGYDYEEEKYCESIQRLVENLPNLETLRLGSDPTGSMLHIRTDVRM